MNNKEIFFNFDNFEFYQKIYIKTLKLDEFKKRTTEKNDFWKGGSEGPTMIPVLKENKIDKENMYIMKYTGGLYKINLESLNFTFIKDTTDCYPYMNNKLNKYFLFKMRNCCLIGAPIYVINNDKRNKL